jgi:microcin C transport system permease protein
MERVDYFIRRFLLVIPTFIGITFTCFLLIQFVPGGPVEQALIRMKGIGGSEQRVVSSNAASISDDQRKEIEAHFGFDKPFFQRYYIWLVRDRIGLKMESYSFPNKNAWQLISERFGVSLIFGIAGFFLTYLVCVPLGILKALYHNRMFDLGTSIIVFVGYAIPVFAFGMILKMVLCGTVDGLFDIFPATGFTSDQFDALSFAGKSKDIFIHMFLPVVCYMIGNFAVLTLLMKNSLLEQISRDYMRCVVAKGRSFSYAVWSHAFRNSLIPVATGFGSILTLMFAGSVIIEQVFEIPGMGRLSLEAIVGRDYPVFMGILSLTSLLGLLGNILSDFCYVLIDPRINFQDS